MQKQLVTIVHVILIVILVVIGLFLFIDMQRVNEQHPTVEFVTEKDVVENASEKNKPVSRRMTKAMREAAVQKMAEALDDMTANEAYDWFQDILEKDIKKLEESVEQVA